MDETKRNTRMDLQAMRQVYSQPLPDLLFEAHCVHREFHDPHEIQGCRLLSIKTGGCPEDCGYCPQSAHYDTGVERQEILDPLGVLRKAQEAKDSGATRFCLGGAWRDAPHGTRFETVLAMVRGIRSLGLEACCTLGMLDQQQAEALAEAGLTAYNHNLDTSPEYYPRIISTRTYSERLETLERVRAAGIALCCGGIIGMGESRRDRCEMIRQFAIQVPPPESVPINVLVRSPGTPIEHAAELDPLEIVRTIATARIIMPTSKVRLSAGRLELSDETQALCFFAGANSIFLGEKLLTTANPDVDRDKYLLKKLGLRLARGDSSPSSEYRPALAEQPDPGILPSPA